MDFFPLQVTSFYEFLETALKLEEYVEGLKLLGYSGGGICDFNSLRSFPHYGQEFKKNDLKLVAGVKIRLVDHLLDFELLLYPQDEDGYLQVLALLQLEKPAFNLDDIKPLTNVSAILKTNNSSFYIDDIERIHGHFLLRLYQQFKIFFLGIEIYSKEEINSADRLRLYAAEHNLSCIAIPEVRYINKTSAQRFDMLQAIKNKISLSTSDRKPSYFLLSPMALVQIYTEEEIQNTVRLAQSSSFDPLARRGQLLKTEPTIDAASVTLKAIVARKLSEKQLDNRYRERAQHELDIISQMGFSDYFLIVADYVAFAKQNDIKVGPGRGSSASSLVSFLLGITEVDPIRYDLIFERFLNPDRQSLPDIDIDFEDTKRDQVIEYLKKKYGPDRVGSIITYSSLQAASSLNAVGEIENIPTERIKKLTSNLIPGNSLAESLKKSYTLQHLYQDAYYSELFNKAKQIEGFPVNASKHAAGIIISQEKLSDLVPFHQGLIEYEYDYLEKMGFVKLDILGLSNLSFLRLIEEKILADKKTIPDLDDNLDDSRCYQTLNNLATYNIFQLESRGMQRAIADIKPQNFSDLYALIALYRPGPMENIKTYAENKHKSDQISYEDPVLAEILKPTYNVIVYQEQVLSIVKRYAGLTSAEADNFRRAISKKDESQLKRYREKFIAGSLKLGHTETQINKVYDRIYRFANYGFNKAHSVSYALIAYRLLYYKTYFPQAFYQASFSRSPFDAKSSAIYEKEFKLLGYQMIRPTLFHSSDQLVFTSNQVFLPFSAIKGLSQPFIDSLTAVSTQGPPLDLFGFFIAMAEQKHDSKNYQRLIDSGVLDIFEKNREKLRANLAELINFGEFGDPSNRINLRPAQPQPRRDYYLETLACGRCFSYSLADLTDLELVAEEKYYLIIMGNDQANTEYQALNEEGFIDIVFDRAVNLGPYAIIAASGNLSRNQKRLYLNTYRKEIS